MRIGAGLGEGKARTGHLDAIILRAQVGVQAGRHVSGAAFKANVDQQAAEAVGGRGVGRDLDLLARRQPDLHRFTPDAK